MDGNIVLFVMGGAFMLVGGIETVYQIYRMVLIDAAARGLKHPRFWGFFAMNGNNSGGLVMYLIVRRRYPVLHMSDTDKKEIEKRKKSAGAGLAFLAVGAIGLIIGIYMLPV